MRQGGWLPPSLPPDNESFTSSTMAEAEDTRERLKSAAMELFSKRGIDGVSVRDIMREAGAKNSASVHYYFRTKEDLIRELVVDAAKRSDQARNSALDALEETGEPIRTSDIVRLIITAETTGGYGARQLGEMGIGLGHARFVAAMQQGHRASFMEAIENRWNRSYIRCIDHIRANLTQLPRGIISQRLMIMFVSLTTVLAAREAALLADSHRVTLWAHPELLENFIAMTTAGLEANLSPSDAA